MKDKLVGLVIPSADNSFFSSLITYVERELHERGCRCIVACSANDATQERECLQTLCSLPVQGIICVSGLSELPDHLVPAELPLVFVDRVPRSSRPIPWVANDDAQAMEQAVGFLIERGCKEILLLPGFTAETQNLPRVQGYRKALEAHKLHYREEYVLRRPGLKSSELEAGELILQAIKSGVKPEAVIASSDRSALGAVRALHSVGYFVPEDVRLICFDHSPYSLMSSPPLTALDRKTDKLAARACAILNELMQSGQTSRPENIINVELIQRDSTR
ncbi:MAG: substrate-binding domain-containing protein [Succinivibrio sp.]|nr:substrate-binding domain-containing protein [Succinivibrio sp.]